MPTVESHEITEYQPFITFPKPLRSSNHEIKVFEDREEEFGPRFSDERSMRAFDDWRNYRNGKLDENEINYELAVPEIAIKCQSLEEACLYTKELMGEAMQETENLNALKGPLNDYIKDKINPFTNKPFGQFCNGLRFRKIFYPASLKSKGYLKQFYLDYDKNKSLHINVVIKPDNESKHSQSSLKLAFCFPNPFNSQEGFKGEKEAYYTMLWNLNYLLFDPNFLPHDELSRTIPDDDGHGKEFLRIIQLGFSDYVRRIQEKANRKRS